MELSKLILTTISELGQFSLALSLGIACLLTIVPLYGGYINSIPLMRASRSLSYTLFILCSFSFLLLAWAFYDNLFSIAYVAQNSNTNLPWYYRLTAVWGGHEGSLLLWVWVQSLWIAAVARFGKSIPLESLSKVLAVMGLISIGFLSFILFTSSPFEILLPTFPVQGRDLNPLLQDPGLIIHPPMLYMGYVGFSVAFAFAIASLMIGRLDTAWARWSRPWTLAAWISLTLGIALGSWWAYYELGWGGWWFWDPVENASLMPWLSGTALLHSLTITEKRNTFKAWTVLLAITTFSLSLLGTFLVRSGVLVSVHSFSSDPTRGLFILSFLIIVIGGSLLLYALRAQTVRSRGTFKLISRESALLINNMLLITALLIVLLGTLLPLIHKQIGLGSISIGKPFFDTTFGWIAIPFALLLGVAPLFRWKKDSLRRTVVGSFSFIKLLLVIAVISFMSAILWILIFGDTLTIKPLIALFLAFWIILLHLFELYQRATYQRPFKEGIRRLNRSYWAMIIAHLGLAVTLIGITMTENFSIERDLRLAKTESVQILNYQFKFTELNDIIGPNYTAYLATFEIYKNDQLIGTLKPEKRFYKAAQSMMSEAAILPFFTHDLYIAMGDKLTENAWAFRVHYKPFIRWIWFGALMMAMAGLLSVSDKRYRFKALNQQMENQ